MYSATWEEFLTKRGDHPLLDGPPACSAYRDSHLVVAPQAVQLVLRKVTLFKGDSVCWIFLCSYQFIGGVAGPGPDLPGAGGELDAARGAVEVVGVVHLATEPQRIAIDDGAEE